jgi:hypothetical protein
MPEDLETPIFSDPYGRFMSACARLKTDNSAVLKKLAAVHPKQVVSRIGTGATAEYVTLIGEDDAGPKHVHYDVAAATYHAKPPKKLASAEALFKKTEQLFGQEVKVYVTARFEVPLAEIPKRGFARDSLRGIPEMRQIGAVFEIGKKGKPGARLAIFSYGDKVRAEVEFATETKIDAGYLKRLYGEAFVTFDVFVLEQEEKNGRPTNQKSMAVRSQSRRIRTVARKR